ncbi:MAG: hypothetical protein IKS35_05285, partial [Clostridia bacterium]|nr:hypothetical protein [Clostridia bacterium]
NVSDEGPETAEPEETEEAEETEETVETEAGIPAAYAFAEAPESVRKEDAHPEDLNPEAMGDEDTRPGIMPNFRRAEPEEPDEAVRTVPRDDLTDTIPDEIPDDILEPEESGAAEEAESSETADEANEEEPVLEEEYPEEDEEVEDPEIMWGSRQNRPHTDLVEEKSKGRVGFYGSEPAMSVPLEQTELEMPEAIAPVRPAPEAPHGRRAVRTAAHLRSRVSAPAESSPLRDEDILMLRDLGMRDEALHMIGQRRYDEIIHNDIQFKKEHNLPLDPRIHPDDDSTGGIVKNRIKRKKLNTRSISLVIRAALSLFVTVVLFFTDTVGLSEFAGWFGIETTVTNPLALAIGLQMLLVLYLINFKDFNRGVVGLFAFKPTLWSIPAVSFILTVLYDGLLFFVPDGTDLTFLHIPFSVCLIWTLVAEMFNVAKDVRDFEVVTDGEIKYVLGQLPHRKRVRVDKDGQVSYVRDLDESGVKLGVIRTHRIRDFDGMSTRRPESMNAMRPILYAIPLLSVLVAAAVYLFSGGTPTAYFNSVHLFGLLGLMTMPLPLVIAYSYPHLRAAVRLHRKGAALIGRCVGETVGPTSPRNMTDEDPTTPAEPKDKTYIVFHDDYMFRKMLEVRVRSLHNLDPAEALRRLGAIAKTLGGDLKRFLDIRNIPAREIGSIRVTRYKTNGIEYEYSRAPGLQYFGTGTFLTEHGIQIPDSLARSELDLERDVARLYMGGPDGLDLSLDIVYMPDPAFVKRVRQLDGYGLYTAIQTHDPCLSEGFMYRMWTEQGRLLAKDGRRITMDVYKPFNFEEDYVTIDERCDLAADSEDGLCEAILTDRKLRLDLRRCLFRAWLGAGLGALILLVLWLNNALNLCNGLTVAVYQSVWCLVTMLFDPFQGRSRDEEAKLKASRRTGKADPDRRK